MAGVFKVFSLTPVGHVRRWFLPYQDTFLPSWSPLGRWTGHSTPGPSPLPARHAASRGPLLSGLPLRFGVGRGTLGKKRDMTRSGGLRLGAGLTAAAMFFAGLAARAAPQSGHSRHLIYLHG